MRALNEAIGYAHEKVWLACADQMETPLTYIVSGV